MTARPYWKAASVGSRRPSPGRSCTLTVVTSYDDGSDPETPPIGDLMGRHTDYTADWPVPARWPADCPECHQPWQPGDAIVRDGGRWVHHQCPPREDDGS